MEKFQNPFITSTEIFDDEDFYNREEIIKEVEKFYHRQNDFNFLIFGQRRIGKTSILKKIEKKYTNQNSYAIYITLQGEAETPLNELLAKIANKINKKINYNTNYNLTQENFINKYLTEINKITGKKQLLLLFDEFDVLGELENIQQYEKTFSFHRFIPYITELIENLKEKNIALKMIFAIGRNYKDLDNERFGQITRFGQQIELSLFPYQIVEQLLSSVDNILPFTDLAKQKIYDITGGHPYFTQCLAHISYNEAIERQKKTIDYFIVEKSIKKTLKRYSNGIVWIWNTLTAKDKIILYIAAHIEEQKININTQNIKNAAQAMTLLPACDNLNETINRLLNIKFLKKTDQNNINFQVEFFRKWIINEITQDLIQKYFAKIDLQLDNILTNARFYYIEKNYEEAEKLFTEITKYRQQHYEAIFYLAKIKIIQNKQHAEIIQLLKKVQKLNPAYKKNEITNYLNTISKENNKYL